MIDIIDAIYLNKENEDAVNRIYDLMYIIRRDGVFGGKESRFGISYFAWLVMLDGKDIGFIYATEEKSYKNGLFIDMALLKEYRGMGIGKYILNKFVCAHKDVFMFSEVLKNNIASNKMCGDVGICVSPCVYMFPRERYKEFVESGERDIFLEALKKPELNARQVLHRVMEDRDKEDRDKE